LPPSVSATCADHGRPGDDLFGPDRPLRHGAGGGDRVLAARAGAARHVRTGDPRAAGAGGARGVSADALVGAPAGGALLDVDRVPAVHDGGELGSAGLPQADLRVGARGAVARRAPRPGGTLGHRGRRGRRNADRSERRPVVARRAGRRRAGADRRRDGRRLLCDRAPRAADRRRVELRVCSVRGRRRGPGRRGGVPRRAAHGVRPERLGGIRRHGRRPDARRAHGHELRAATLPRDDGERGGPGGAGGSHADRLAGPRHSPRALVGGMLVLVGIGLSVGRGRR